MAALNSSDITQKVIEPIHSFGKSVGSLVAKAPQYAPIIPTPGGGISATGLSTFGSDIKSKIHNRYTSEGSNLSSKFF
jgi:hypothetical protein